MYENLMQKYVWAHLNTNKLLSWPICKITEKGEMNCKWMKGLARGIGQFDSVMAEEKQNVTQNEEFLPHYQDRSFFLP